MQAMKNEVEIYKKQNRIYKHTIDAQMIPMQKMQQSLTHQTTKANYIEARHEDLERQVEMISR
jgi:hypothetical protein